MYFEDYGRLEWLEPAEYFAEPWRYHRTATGANGVDYDIVAHRDSGEYRYTSI